MLTLCDAELVPKGVSSSLPTSQEKKWESREVDLWEEEFTPYPHPLHPPFTWSGLLYRKFPRPAAYGYGHVRAVTRARRTVHTPVRPGAHVTGFHRPGGVGWAGE